MKKLALAAMLLGAVASSTAFAHGRGRVHLGFHFGAPLFWHSPYWYYPPPYYYYPPYPPTVFVPASPPIYVERSDAAPDPSAQEWWYYCDTSRGYYPYVKTCPSGWQRVPPAPPPAQ